MTARASKSRKRTAIQARNETLILDAALDVFSSYGYRGATIDQIAQAAKMSKPNLLYYFARKQDIYIAVLEATLADWLEPLTGLDAAGDPAVELWGYIERKLELSRKKPKASRLFANEMLQGAPRIRPFLDTELKQLVDEKCNVIHAWIDAGKLRSIEPMHLLFMIWSATQHYADFEVQIDALSSSSRNQRYTDAAATLKTIFLDGLLPRN